MTGSWTLIGIILLGGNKNAMLLQLTKTGSASALTNLKLTRTAISAGAHIDWLVDTDLNVVSDEMLDAIISPAGSPPNLYLMAVGSVGQIKLDRLQGVQEIGIYAKGNGSLQVQGSAF